MPLMSSLVSLLEVHVAEERISKLEFILIETSKTDKQ